MQTLLASALLVPALPAIGAERAPAPQAKPVCRHVDVLSVDRAPGVPAIHPLGDEPPAKGVLTVLRTVDGCSRPVVVNRRVGTEPRR